MADKIVVRYRVFVLVYMVASLTEKIFKVPFVSRKPDNPAPVILIVDDDPDSREMMKILLEMWKFQVIEAIDGIEAINVTEKICPDVILMDVRLPKMDGFDVTRRIRQTENVKNVPIIFLSACAEAIDKQKAKSAGGNEYLTKPLDFEDLEKTLDKYVLASKEISV